MTSEPVHRHSILTESWVFATRLFLQWRRYPMVPMQALLFPALLLVIYSLLISKSMMRLTGTTSLDLLIPVCAVAGGMSGALGAGMAMPYDRNHGLLTRMWMMPVHRASALTGTLLAEGIRTLAATAIIAGTGVALGFRFEGNLLALVVYLLIPVVLVVSFATIVITVGLSNSGHTILPWMSTATMGLALACTVPAHVLPAVVRPLAEYQPVAPMVAAMRALSTGSGSIWLPLLLTVVWVAILGAIFGPIAAKGYRKAAEMGDTGD
jgi:ABC-2 type transport system permease protein